MRPKILFSQVTKRFNLSSKQSDRIYKILSLNEKNKPYFYPVKDLSFAILEGETIGIVGLNGSGKSTLRNLLTKIISPISGMVEINGKTSLISNSTGFNNQLTGLENIELRCLIYGYNKAETNSLKEKIIEFAGLGEYIHQPVKRYSSGMKSRLSFAVSAYINPDILIIDEALSVGDQAFYHKCVRKINSLKKKGKTIIFISHSLTQVEELCDRVIWMHSGKIEKFGETKAILFEYKSFIQWFNSLNDLQKEIYRTELSIEQYNADLELFNSGKAKKKRFRSLSFMLQVYLLSVIIILSGISMFGVTPIKLIEYLLIRETEEIKDDSNPYEYDIHSNGIVSTMQADVYANKCFQDYLTTAEYLDELYVEKQIGTVYQVQINDMEGYMSEEDIVLIEETLPYIELQLDDFSSVFPDAFEGAYIFFSRF